MLKMALDQTEEYFNNLRVLLANCSREIVDQSGKDMLVELKNERSDLSRHVTALKDHAENLDWESESKKKEYIDEIEDAAWVLEENLGDIEPEEGVDEETGKAMRNAARLLSDCTAGLQEDLGN